jgi:hypothetical protein
MLPRTTVPEKIVVDGHEYRPGNKVLFDNLPPDIVREIMRREMEKIEAAGAGYFPQLHTADAPDAKPAPEPALVEECAQ